MEVLANTKDIIVAVSAVAVAGVAVYGVNRWRVELTGKAEFELAQRIMLLGFRLASGFEKSRNPFTMPIEFAGRQAGPEESDKETAVLNEWYARHARLAPLRDDLPKFEEASWEAEILLASTDSTLVSEVNKIYRRAFGDLDSAIQSNFKQRLDELRPGHESELDWRRALEKTIYSRNDDDFAKIVKDANDQLETALRRYVK